MSAVVGKSVIFVSRRQMFLDGNEQHGGAFFDDLDQVFKPTNSQGRFWQA
jgi:hypothetical protein